MTWAATETSAQSARRIELYTFTLGATAWRYTNAASDYTNGSTWTAIPIDRGSVRRGADFTDSSLEIRLPASAAVPALFRIAPPPGVLAVQVQAVHPHDGDLSPVYSGRVLACEYRQGGAEAVLQCDLILSALKRPGLRRVISRNCGHVLYETGAGKCNATKSGTTVTVETAGNPITITGTLADHNYKGGHAEFANGDIRMITDNEGDQITLLWPVPTLDAGHTFTVYRGCDHTLTGCGSFSNTSNFGGFPFMVETDPYQSGLG